MSRMLRADEAAAYLGIDSKDPAQSLAYYRSKSLLRGVLIGRQIVYLVEELDRFIREMWDIQHPAGGTGCRVNE